MTQNIIFSIHINHFSFLVCKLNEKNVSRETFYI